MSTSTNGESTTDNDEVEEAANLMRALELEEKCKHLSFRWEQDINNSYKIGDEVVPTDSGRSNVKAVLFGKALKTKESVVIKMRNKTRSFKDEQEINDWVSNMKLLYHLQEKNNPHIAKVLDIIEDQTSYYVVMEHVKGRDLFDYFVQEKIYGKSYKLPVAKQIARELISGLDELHGSGLIHKDIKLENIVLDESKIQQTGDKLVCTCKIIDFDTVEIYRPGNKSFHVLGTDQYIAPETYAGYSSPASDMWALGVIFYTILTGSFPFHYALFDDQPGENYVGHARMDQIRRRLRIARIDWSNKVWGQDPKAKDFVRRCFACDQKRRLTVKEALVHPWLTSD
jgi:serine/threonine protein kinase